MQHKDVVKALNLFVIADFEKLNNKNGGNQQLRLTQMSIDFANTNADWPGGIDVEKDPVLHASSVKILRFAWVFIANKLDRPIPENVLTRLKSDLNELNNVKRIPSLRQLFGESIRKLRNGRGTAANYCRIVDLFGGRPNKTTGRVVTSLLAPQNIHVFLKNSQSLKFEPATNEELLCILSDFDAYECVECVPTEVDSVSEIPTGDLSIADENPIPSNSSDAHLIADRRQHLETQKKPDDNVTQSQLQHMAVKPESSVLQIPINSATLAILLCLLLAILLLQLVEVLVAVIPIVIVLWLWTASVLTHRFIKRAIKHLSDREINDKLSGLVNSKRKLRSDFAATDAPLQHSFNSVNRITAKWLPRGSRWSSTTLVWLSVITLVAALMTKAMNLEFSILGFIPTFLTSAVICLFLWLPTVVAYFSSKWIYNQSNNLNFFFMSFAATFVVLWCGVVALMSVIEPSIIADGGFFVTVWNFTVSPITGLKIGNFWEAMAAFVCFLWAMLPFGMLVYGFVTSWVFHVAIKNDLDVRFSEMLDTLETEPNLSPDDKRKLLNQFIDETFDIDQFFLILTWFGGAIVMEVIRGFIVLFKRIFK